MKNYTINDTNNDYLYITYKPAYCDIVDIFFLNVSVNDVVCIKKIFYLVRK